MDGVSFENSNDQFYSKVDSKGEVSGIFESRSSTLFGMTCDGMDIITKSIDVPIEAKVGDWLCLGAMGAYTHGCKSNFNGMTTTEKIITWPTIVAEETPVNQKVGALAWRKMISIHIISLIIFSIFYDLGLKPYLNPYQRDQIFLIAKNYN